VEQCIHQHNAVCDRKRDFCGQVRDVWFGGVSYEGKYKIDCCGNIWSLRREKIVNNRLYAWAGKAIQSFIDENGYRYVNLSNGKKARKTAIHTLVLNSFQRPALKGEVCRHLDGNKINNSIWNLCWGTYKENYEDSRRHKTNQEGNRSVLRKLSEEQAKEIFKRKENSFVLAKEYNVAPSTIRAVKIKQNWKFVNNN